MNEHLRAQRVLDEAKRRELQMVLLGKNHKGITQSHSTRIRTKIPKDNPFKTKFTFPVPPRPFNHRMKNIEKGVILAAKKESKTSKIPLQSKSKNLPVIASDGGYYDHFSEERIENALFDKNKAEYPDFFNRRIMAEKLSEKVPSLVDDLYNNQRLIRPRFVQDKFDEEEDFYDLNVKNKDRLKAFEGINKVNISRLDKKYDIERVDRIVDEIKKYRNKPFDFEDDGTSNNFNKKESTVFRRSASNLVLGQNKYDFGGDREIFVKKNEIDDKSYFQNPGRYKDWDDKFNFEDYA